MDIVKYSQLPQAAALQGDEIVALSQNGTSVKSTVNDIRAYAVGDDDEQFSNIGYYNGGNGSYANNANYLNSGFIPINRNYPIKANTQGTAIVSPIVFFDGNKNYVSGITRAADVLNKPAVHEIAATEIPKDAVFFVSCTQKGITSSYSNGPASKESIANANADAINLAAERAAFIKLWTANSGARYNTQTGFFELNGINDIPYQEALTIYQYKQMPPYYNSLNVADIRTNLIGYSALGGWDAKPVFNNVYKGNALVHINLSSSAMGVLPSKITNFIDTYQTKNLVAVLSNINVKMVTGEIKIFNDPSKILPKFTTLKIIELNKNIQLQCCPLLSLESLQILVNNAKNTSAIMVCVHADVMAKLSDTANTEWHKVMTDAVAKNIQFTTV